MAIGADDPQFQAFLFAEMQQESGGNSNAVSPDGALGLWQVMPANVGSWSRQALGYSISPQEFLQNPTLQKTIVTRVLLNYVNQYGYQGASSAWFSGNPNLATDTANRGVGASSVASYVNSVMGKMTQLGHTPPNWSGVSAYGHGSSAVLPAARPSFDWWAGIDGTSLGGTTSQANESVGLIAAFIGSDPELKDLYSQAVAGSWSQDKFISALQGTSWWSTNAATVRQNMTTKSTDPASWSQHMTNSTAMVQELATKLGVPISGQNLANVATTAALYGYNESQVQQVLSTYLQTVQGGWYGGYAGQVQLALKEYASDMGIPMSDSTVGNYVQQITAGTNSLQAVRAWVQTQAALAFPAYAQQINEGMTVGKIAQPYASALSQILEQNPNSVDLQNPLLRSAMTYKDPTTGAPAVKQLYDYETDLRKNPMWVSTNNARESLMGTANTVLSNMGMSSVDMGAGPQTKLNAPTNISENVKAQSMGLSGQTKFSTLQGKEALSTPPSPTAQGATSLAAQTAFTSQGTPQQNKPTGL